LVLLSGCRSEIAILDKHADQKLSTGFAWTAAVSSPGCSDENPDYMIVIIGNFQPNTLGDDGSFQLGQNGEVLNNQTMQYLCQTVPRTMVCLEEISAEDVQKFIQSSMIFDKFPMRADANSSKGVTVSSAVRRTPCPEGMSEHDFIEVRRVYTRTHVYTSSSQHWIRYCGTMFECVHACKYMYKYSNAM